MNFDPKKDIRFQAILAGIISGIASLETEAPPEKQRKMISDLGQLRIEFFWTCCFHKLYNVEGRRFDYDLYKAMRDAPAAQRFLRENPGYFAKIDLALCEVASSIRRELKEGLRGLGQ